MTPKGERGVPDAHVATALMVVVGVIYLLTATYDGAQVNDNRATNLSAWAVATTGSPALPDAWGPDVRWADRASDGSYYTDRFPGTIAHAVPFHFAATWGGVNQDPSHPALFNYSPGGVSAAVVAALFIGVLYLVFRQLVDRRLALGGTLVAAFATATWSVSADAIWTHGPASLWLAVGMLALAKGHHSRSGLAFAVAILARPQTAVAPAVMGIWRGAQRRSLRAVVTIGITSFIGVVAMAVYSRMVFDTWVPVAGYNPSRIANVATGRDDSFVFALMNTLAHDRRGVLVYTPFLLVLMPFVRHGWRVAPDWVRSSAVAGVIYLVVQLRANHWAGGANYFGSRLTIESLVLLAPLLVVTVQERFRERSPLRAMLLVAVATSFVIHAVGATVLSVDASGREHWETYVRDACVIRELPDAECEKYRE